MLAALSLAILNSWFLYTVVSFYKEISKESLEIQDTFPLDVELHAKSYGDVYNEQYRNNDTYNPGYGQPGSHPSRSTAQLYHQSDGHPQANTSGYGDIYGQHGQYLENRQLHNQHIPVRQPNEMMYESPRLQGYDGPTPSFYTSPHVNY